MAWQRWTMVALLALISLNALAAGTSFLFEPDGSGIGIPQDWLDGAPFDSYRVLGALLFGLGILHGVAAWLQGWKSALAWFWSGMSAGGLLIWIIVQALFMGSFRHPIQTILQAACLLVGMVVGLLALGQWRRRTLWGRQRIEG